MLRKVMRLLDDLQGVAAEGFLLTLVFGIVGIVYIVSGSPNPQEAEQVAQSTRIVIGQSIIATGISTAILKFITTIFGSSRRWKNEDQLAELQNSLNNMAERNEEILQKLDEMSLQSVKASDLGEA